GRARRLQRALAHDGDDRAEAWAVLFEPREIAFRQLDGRELARAQLRAQLRDRSEESVIGQHKQIRKAKGKRQRAKGKGGGQNGKSMAKLAHWFCNSCLPFALCLLPSTWACGFYFMR